MAPDVLGSGFRNRAQRHSHLASQSRLGIGKSDLSAPNFDRHVLKSSTVARLHKSHADPKEPKTQKAEPHVFPTQAQQQATACESKQAASALVRKRCRQTSLGLVPHTKLQYLFIHMRREREGEYEREREREKGEG